MKEHEWRIEGIEVERSGVNSDYILRGLLWNTDQRRRAFHFAVSITPGRDTLRDLIERLAVLKGKVDITAAPKPRRGKCVAPIVDERQLSLLDLIKSTGGCATADGLTIGEPA